MQLFQINRGLWISLNEKFRIQYFAYFGGASQWVVSEQGQDSVYFNAIAGASTLEEAKKIYFNHIQAVAA
jgi:hypothetical protein